MPRLRENVTTNDNDLRRSYRFWGGPIAFQGNWQDPTFHGHPTLSYNYGSFDGCSYKPLIKKPNKVGTSPQNAYAYVPFGSLQNPNPAT